MKKAVPSILAIAAGFSLAAASALGASIFEWTHPAPFLETPAAREQTDSSPQAICKQVEVQLDEGYGVSSQETRVICQESP